MTGSGLAVFLSVVAGLAGAVQVSMMAQLGDRISIVGAVAFATSSLQSCPSGSYSPSGRVLLATATRSITRGGC